MTIKTKFYLAIITLTTGSIAFVYYHNKKVEREETTPALSDYQPSYTSSASYPTKQSSGTTIKHDDKINVVKTVVDKEVIIEKLKAKAQRDWPNDYMTQDFWVNEQIDAYEYMLTIEDNSIKKRAQRDWPLDFMTQKFWYNEQLEAKERMK